MPGAKTRRQVAAAAAAESQGKEEEIAQAANGNAITHDAARAIDSDDDDEPRENIFLLWPNIIGTTGGIYKL